MLARREFLRRAAGGAGALALAARFAGIRRAAAASAPDSTIEIVPGEAIGTISPNIYGHFAENLGGVIYDGVFVGKDSRVANTDGIRQALIEHMRKIKAPVVRWPGGCFADSYDWRDGTGPADKRPRRSNFWGGFDPNRFGTTEFDHFCRLIGAEPYLAANVRGLPAIQFDRWVEYCNSPAGNTTLADQRAADGYRDPLDVHYWGVGNESWGCGGEFTAEEYAVQFRRYTTWVPRYGEGSLHFVASGPGGDDLGWTRGFFQELLKKGRGELRRVWGYSLHYYSWNLSRGKSQDWNAAKGDALKFQPVDWYELLHQGEGIEPFFMQQWQTLADFDPQHSIKLVLDEWGPWYKPGSEITPGFTLEQMITLRDAVFSGMTLDIFNRNCDKVIMANCAQLINCLNSLYLAHEDGFCVTPVGHLFDLYSAHQGGQAIRAEFSAPEIHYDRDGTAATFWGLKGSCSIQGKQATLTVVNPSVSEPREAEISVHGGSISAVSGRVLTSADIHAHNTFDQPNALQPATISVQASGGRVRHMFSPASVTALSLTLA